jgi:TDG/mug DNA glycosylase family protein
MLSRQELEAARGKVVADVIAPGLKVLFCGINPGLYSGAMGHHFARPGNRFWPALHRSGFTDRVYDPAEERELLNLGMGITNVVMRTTAGAQELSGAELRAGARRLARKVKRYRPKYLAILGMQAYRTGFGKPKAKLGPQEASIGSTRVWVLPNPSGLNAHYTLAGMEKKFAELRAVVKELRRARGDG